ncbi:hypothetical protein C1703_35820 [Streptomyces sp. Go-475]|nr:hypothetical protein C1703_35820 [Streptomyces sp. Go-475]
MDPGYRDATEMGRDQNQLTAPTVVRPRMPARGRIHGGTTATRRPDVECRALPQPRLLQEQYGAICRPRKDTPTVNSRREPCLTQNDATYVSRRGGCGDRRDRPAERPRLLRPSAAGGRRRHADQPEQDGRHAVRHVQPLQPGNLHERGVPAQAVEPYRLHRRRHHLVHHLHQHRRHELHPGRHRHLGRRPHPEAGRMAGQERGVRTDQGQRGHRRLRQHQRDAHRRRTAKPALVSTTLPGDGTVYRLVARHSRKVADVEGGATANNTNVLRWPWLNKPIQKWTFVNTGDGYYRIKGVASGKLLEVGGPSRPPVTATTSSSTATAGSASPSRRAAPPTEPTSSSSRTRHWHDSNGRSSPRDPLSPPPSPSQRAAVEKEAGGCRLRAPTRPFSSSFPTRLNGMLFGRDQWCATSVSPRYVRRPLALPPGRITRSGAPAVPCRGMSDPPPPDRHGRGRRAAAGARGTGAVSRREVPPVPRSGWPPATVRRR